MPVTIASTRQPLDATQQGSLRKLFDSPAFSLLKEVVSSKCIEQQINAMNATLYPKNEAAIEDAKLGMESAAQLSDLLDILDDLEKEEQEWWTIKVEPRR